MNDNRPPAAEGGDGKPSMSMTRGERDTLLQIVRRRERLAKADASVQAAHLKADFERQLAAVYDYDQDKIWKQAYSDAEAEVEKAQEKIRERNEALGIPREFAPRLDIHWYGRGENAVRERRIELTRVAYKRIEYLEKQAKHQIEHASLEIQTQLMATGLESANAKAFLEQMPTAAQLMPPLSVEEVQRQLVSASVE